MRNTRKSGQILRSKKRPRPALRSGRGSRTNSNTSRQIPARVIEADSARAATFTFAVCQLTADLRIETMVVSAAGQHRACNQSMFSMRSRAFAYPPQRSRGRPDSAGNVKKADLLGVRVVERMNRLGGRLQQDRAA